MALFGKLLNFFGIKKRVSILVVGLDNSGKTTILNILKCMKDKDVTACDTVPTIGFSVEKFATKTLDVTAFDMSGQGRYRNLWSHHYKDVDGIIFVIDSSDTLRMVVAKDELFTMINHEYLRNKKVPILFLANKVDLTDSISVSKIRQILSLDTLTCPWNIEATTATTGEGVTEGLEWLWDQLVKREKKSQVN